VQKLLAGCEQVLTSRAKHRLLARSRKKFSAISTKLSTGSVTYADLSKANLSGGNQVGGARWRRGE
jgi:hypothetical protein